MVFSYNGQYPSDPSYNIFVFVCPYVRAIYDLVNSITFFVVSFQFFSCSPDKKNFTMKDMKFMKI